MPLVPLAEVAVHLRPDDEVAVAAKFIPAGAELEFHGERLIVKQPVKLGHKLAVRGVKKGGAVRKYGQIIGFARSEITPGEHVHVHNLGADLFERDYAFCQDCPPPPRAIERRTF
ncbi:MAG: UxaA family hydrolase, partial [Gemmataceae bacterium]|nr:UxaA family hydrolase [Gemmataceae bacterium]